ncbi:MAG: ABC transporter permease [Methanomicrobiales archaeon]|nr:ABC transporter permease [Methanomicrobiales archaeon]
MPYTYRDLINDLKGAWAIARKDFAIYYLKPNIYMSGVLFPLFLLLAFAIGRNAPVVTLIPGLIAVTSLFSASTIEPVSIPIERRTKTFDRLISAPISISALVLGESIGGFLFSYSICLLMLAAGIILNRLDIISVPVLTFGIGISCFTFTNMGTVFAAYPTENVGEVMPLQNLVRLPLLFISGVFIPWKRCQRVGGQFQPSLHSRMPAI